MAAISIHKVIVPRHHQKVTTGQSINTSVLVTKNNVTDEISDISSQPLMSLYDPNDVRIVANEPMAHADVGTYSRAYQIRANDPVGRYTASFIAEDNGYFAVLDRVLIFRVVKTITSIQFTYQALQDQNGNVWYWWINENQQIVSSLTAPSFVIVSGTQLPGTVSWIQVVSDLPATRYIFPSILGVPEVSGPQPTGSGVIGSPIFTALDGLSYRLHVTIANQVIPRLV